MMFSDKIYFRYENYTNQTDALCVQNTETSCIKRSVVYSDCWNLKA
jgi:hypothetical protein